MSISFDLPNRPLSFFAFHFLYREWAYMIACWSIVLAVLAAMIHLTACYELGMAAILTLMFIVLMTVGYEESLHMPSSYTITRRVILIGLGWASFMFFATGLLLGLMQLCNRGLPQ